MAIVEALVGAVFTVLLEKLASNELLNFLRPVGIDAQMKKWGQKLLLIEAVLADADNKQTDNRAVREWLNEQEDLAYDVDDLVDEFNTEASLRKLRESQQVNKPSTSKVLKFIPTCCSNFSLRDYMSDHGIASKLKQIDGRLEDLTNQISTLNLVRDVRGKAESKGQRIQPTSLEESNVFGREEDKKKLLEIIFMGFGSNHEGVRVIPIVGMGGVGKTTLAQTVYNDDKLKDEFDIRVWVCVSDQFDAFMVTKTILMNVSAGGYDNFDLNMLQVKLTEELSNKRFLLVLDDVWNEKHGDWDILRRPFLAGKNGSSIIVTTRNKKVAQTMSPVSIYPLKELSSTDALKLLAQNALGAKTFDARPDLRDIGESAVRICKNLPLAVKAVGAILRTKVSPEDWDDLLNNNIWISGEESEILPALKLSYQYLPSELKRCFAYCAIFPKDYEFDKSQLVHLWMGEGFLRQTKQKRSIIEIGEDCFDELLSRSFFQQSSANPRCFMMHDLHNDLAMHVASNKYLRLDKTLRGDLQGQCSEKVRHSSFIPDSYQYANGFNFLHRVPRLRTFLALRTPWFCVSQGVLHDLLTKLCCLRLLSLSCCASLHELPSSIGDLRHLRYLNLGHSSIVRLPESLSNLINLQVLILSGCVSLTELPSRMEDIINLWLLDTAGTPELHQMPQGIAQLISLEILSKMIVSKNGGLKLNDLGNLSHLRGEISIVELQNVKNVEEAMAARLKHKPRLNRIRLAWSDIFDDSRNEVLETNVLGALEPHKNLSSLAIEFYGGAKLPSWIGDPSFSKLTEISFDGCKKCSGLTALGHLPLLTHLSIKGMDQVEVIGVEFYGNVSSGSLPFRLLQTLTFEGMPNWKEWVGLLTQEVEGTLEFPKLCELSIKNCPNLIRLPILLLPVVSKLKVGGCCEAVLSFMHNLTSLSKLNLQSIKGLTSVCKAFPQLPPALEEVKIENCEDLETLWFDDNISESLVNLKKVIVGNCPKLLSIRESGVLPEMVEFASLELLPNSRPSYKQLIIHNPSSEEMITLQDCCNSLDYLQISSWVNLNLTTLLKLDNHIYSCLTEIILISCDGMESFPHGGLPTPNLRDLRIEKCKHLKSLPNEMKLLSSLQGLYVEGCPSLVEPFPQGNIPPSLSYLSIEDCGNLNPLGEWGLHKLTSLDYFRLRGGYPELVSFSEFNDDQYHMLPPSLTFLTLSDLPSLETLSTGFQNLTSLRSLWIRNCPKLSALPAGTPLSRLGSLYISGCPLLKKQCLMKRKGDYWPIIAEIPHVRIDRRSIWDPEFPPVNSIL